MTTIFTDLPVDSSDLATLHGYEVEVLLMEPAGGPMDAPSQAAAEESWLAPPELNLGYSSAATRMAPAPRRVLVMDFGPAPHGAQRFGEPFPSNSLMLSLASVPFLCFALVWLIARLPA